MKPTDKHFRCNICQRGFTRIDHLKRHHLRHSGDKPYSCLFCNTSFARCDNLRDHYTTCARRGDRDIPETETSLKPGSSEQASSHRGSIKFLLNGGTDSFTETFRLPPRSDRTLSLNYHNRNGFEEVQRMEAPSNIDGGRSAYSSGVINSDHPIPQFFQATSLWFFNGPFGDGQHPMESSCHSNDIAYQTMSPSEQNNPVALPGDPPIFERSLESERPFAAALVQSILARIRQVLEPKAQEEVSAHLHFLLTTARIRKFITLYFKYWQPSCAMLENSFDPETIPPSLLAAVSFMGAIYSTDTREAELAKRVLDFAELFVFSNEVFLAESEMCIVFSGDPCRDEEPTDWARFQNLQAGFIMVIVQYWSGNHIARNRAIENRFGEIVKVARRMELVKARHLPNDGQIEELWIQKECRIRTMSIISLLDCAFFFYQNYPCRLTLTEMECDLPCDESLFFSEHPFSEPNFRFSRDLQISEAFENLFAEAPESDTMDLTTLDMFILIHILYSFINTHMTLLGPFIRKGHIRQPSQTSQDRSKNAAQLPEDSILIAIRIALSRWRDYWIAMRNRVSNAEWASMGFYKNAYNFWLVSQLLITNKDAVDVVMQMEVNCEDKLEKLKVLLLDDQEDL
ncbi:transcriptional regulator family: Fungal Specific TF [Penicillium paradoxum]|uniref:transcriptional regulator family: Fungal Specific TF n=1 Tax=Penicillium paradoxum TaxID=176176 RepID=UPI0025480250|nr:transcriptional regulator family: Fungal Specific TF [Penicillium paradoxum]KAJ5787619.1 transcriptional regulator family: Fungal Specific TF [Penicillium paradoxum]